MKQDIAYLRELAKQVREHANSPAMEDLRQEWKRHNRLDAGRPMICVSPEGAWTEILPEKSLQCKTPFYRGIEHSLKQKLYWVEEIKDDTPISKNYILPYITEDSGYIDGRSEVMEVGENRGSFHYKVLLEDIQRDIHKLQQRKVTFLQTADKEREEKTELAIGDILPIERRGSHWWSLGLTREIIKLIGLENLMMAMYDDPDGLHQLMEWMMKEHMAYIEQFKDLGLLTLNNGEDLIASGGIGCSDELPSATFRAGNVEFKDLWGFSESQETVGISPAMFGEFVFPYQLPLLEKFGINCYGCCEPVETRWDWLKTIPRLRRLSVSPWSSMEETAEILGKDYIFSRKPNPALVCMGFAEDQIREDLSRTFGLANKIQLEIILKDTHTVENQPQRLGQWVKIAREISGYYP